MRDVNRGPGAGPGKIDAACLCAALRQASRAVTRVYDAELRQAGLRSTQLFLLWRLDRAGEVRQGDLGAMAALDETTLTRNLRPLEKKGWVTTRAGADRREKLVAITEAGKAKVEQAGPAWARAQARMRKMLPEGAWDLLLSALPDVTRAATSKVETGGDS